MGESDPAVGADELVEYCRVQARLLAGRAETVREEVDDLLAEIDADLADVRTTLEGRADDPERTVGPQAADRPEGVDVDALEDAESTIEAKQALVEAKGARMDAFRDLAAGYTDLAEELAGVEDGGEAIERVVRFEVDRDAPDYFEERLTVAEAAAESGADGAEDGGGDGDGDEGENGG